MDAALRARGELEKEKPDGQLEGENVGEDEAVVDLSSETCVANG